MNVGVLKYVNICCILFNWCPGKLLPLLWSCRSRAAERALAKAEAALSDSRILIRQSNSTKSFVS